MSPADEKQTNPIRGVIEELSREAEQEKTATAGKESYLADADVDQLISREREYKDAEKQWVRKRWLKCANEVVAKNGRKIKYLTLPAYHRIDVSLFRQHNLIAEFAGAPDTLAVAAFETDPTKFARMSSHIPKLQLFGHAAVEDVIVDTTNKYYSDLASMFPFDIVNFDLTTSLTPKHEGPYSRIMMALNGTLQRQADHPGLWAMFLTFRNVKEEWEKTALETFFRNLQDNLDQYPKVRDTFANRYQRPSVVALASDTIEAAVTQSVVKWLVDRAHEQNVTLVNVDTYCYRRYVNPRYVITKVILQFRRGQISPIMIPTKGTPRQAWMDDDLARCISQSRHFDVEEILLKSPDGSIDGLQKEVEELVRSLDEASRIAL